MVKEVQVKRYLAHLKLEIRTFFVNQDESDVTIESIYFGGGTPSVLSPAQIAEVLAEFPSEKFAKEIEICLEANPEDITVDWARGVLELGVNRISLGVQTRSAPSLAAIQRSSPETIDMALAILSEAGHQNINIDFILGLPHVTSGQTLEDVRYLLERYPAIRHTSVYFLEKGKYPKDWATTAMNDEQQRIEYTNIREYLLARGMHHYEISNFGFPGYKSRHNGAYWNHSEVRGFGLAAASYIGGERFENTSSFSQYYTGEVVGRERLSSTQLQLERGMFGLRTFALPVELATAESVKDLERAGLIEIKNSHISPTLA